MITIRKRLIRLIGNRYLHSKRSNWSIRNRGKVHLNHMMMNITTAVFPKNQKMEGM